MVRITFRVSDVNLNLPKTYPPTYLPDMEKKKTFLRKQGLSQNYFTQNRNVNYNKKHEFATKQRKM